MVLSFFREDYPWIYDAGKEVISILKSKKSKSEKEKVLEEFINLVDFTFEHPIMRDINRSNKETRMMLHELPMILRRSFEKYI